MNKLYFDLETTSAEKDTCRIIQLGIKQIDELGNVLVNKSKMYNPGVPITPSATEAHGITDAHVKNYPSFYPDCKKLKGMFETSTLIGYNIITFDIPVLLYEFERAGVELNISRNIIDVMRLETQLSPRTLSAVYERYTGKALEGAHDAMADVEGTETVFNYQKEKIINNKLNAIELLEKAGLPKDAADFFGKLKYDETGHLIYNFGKKCFGKRVIDEVQYTNWVLGEPTFPSEIKRLLREELKKLTKKQFTHPAPHKNIMDFSGTSKNGLTDDDLPF